MGELFDRVHIIEVELGSDGSLVKKESYRFPPSGPGADKQAEENEVSTIVQFCFPEETIPKPRSAAANSNTSGLRRMMDNAKLLRHAVQQTFSFVLTETDGSKRYGYCRRWLKDAKHAECACVISLVPSMALFAQLLDIILERRAAPNTAASSASALFTFLRAVLANAFPKPGDSLTVKTFNASGGSEPDVYTITRPRSETLADFVSVGGIFSRISVAVVVELWAALLCERRVLITSADPVRLSSTMNALSALMHPFSWQHVFIPILPKSLSGYVTAPMPFFIGCLDSTLDAVRSMGMPLEEIYLVSADTGAVSMRPGDVPPDFLPREPAALLLNTLVALYIKYIKGQADTEIDTSPVNGLIMRAFLRCLKSVFIGCQRFFKKERPAGYKGHEKKVYFHADEFEKYVENGAPPFPEGAGKDAVGFVRALKMSQVFEMYMSELEDAVAQGMNIANISPLLNGGTTKITVPLLLRSANCFDMPDGPSQVCSVCMRNFDGGEPCSIGPNGCLFHTKCYQCSKCGRLLEGSVSPQNTGDLVCDVCYYIESSGSSSGGGGGSSSSAGKLLSMVKKKFRHGGSSLSMSLSTSMKYGESTSLPFEEAETIAPVSPVKEKNSLVRSAHQNLKNSGSSSSSSATASATRRKGSTSSSSSSSSSTSTASSASSATTTAGSPTPAAGAGSSGAWKKSVSPKITTTPATSTSSISKAAVFSTKSSPSLTVKPVPTSSTTAPPTASSATTKHVIPSSPPPKAPAASGAARPLPRTSTGAKPPPPTAAKKFPSIGVSKSGTSSPVPGRSNSCSDCLRPPLNRSNPGKPQTKQANGTPLPGYLRKQ